MFQNERNNIDQHLATSAAAESLRNESLAEDEQRERMVAARREQQRLMIVRRLTMSGMLCLG